MRFSPLGVAMGVSGAVHSQDVHPAGHVPLVLGVWQPRMTPMGPGTLQQSSPGAQQLLPQHVPPGPQRGPLHGGTVQTPLSQYGCIASHFWPHAPQLLMSLSRLVQVSPQQTKSQKPHDPPPELLELEVPPRPPLPPFPPVWLPPPLPPIPMAPPFPPVPLAEDDELDPPEPPPSIAEPQPAMNIPIKPRR